MGAVLEREQVTRMRLERTHRSDDEHGVTLVELLITIVILSMIMGAIAASFVTAFRSSGPTAELIRQSNDAQLIAGFLVRDAQSAGGTNPATGTIDNTIGVSKTDAAGCNPDASLVLRFSWIDHVAGSGDVKRVANYYFDSSAKEIIRKTCTDGTSTSSVTLGREIAVATASCIWDDPDTPAGPVADPNCGWDPSNNVTLHLPDTVTLHLESTPPADAAPFVYDLTASLRPEDQDLPNGSNSANFPLITFGGGPTPACTFSTSGVGSNGNPDVTIYGPVLINTTNGRNCDAWNFNGDNYYWSSGPVSILNGGTCTSCPPGTYGNFTTAFTDPFAATFAPLDDSCAAGGGNPAPTGTPAKYRVPAGQPALVFPQKLKVPVGGAQFGPGTFVFCQGIDSNNATITTDPGVTFYIVPSGAWDWNIGTGDSSIDGFVYAPGAAIDISGGGSLRATSIVGASFTTHGNPEIFLGTPFANNITIAGPRTILLPKWTVGRPYPNTTITATGGVGSYTWSATHLPQGLTMNSSSGVISGTPQAAGSVAGQITVLDSLGDVTIKPYTLIINPAPVISGPATLTDWTIDRDYPGTAMIATGGTTPYTWTQTGLPPGLSLNAGTGVVSGRPNTTGTFTPTITLTDAAGATTTRPYTIKINAAPSIDSSPNLPNWTAGQPYPNRTMTANNGTTPYSWAASGLPTGLTIDALSGLISGTPNAAGTFSVSITVTDKAGASATRNETVKINPAPGIATASLPIAEVGRPYNFRLTQNGGTPPYTWSLVSPPPSLAWLSIDANTGTLTGTPTASGAPNVTVRVTDDAGASAQTTYTLTIAGAVQISGPAELPDWTRTFDYPGTAIIGTGGVTPFTWSQTGLPAGLSINPDTGVISGTPTATGTFPVTITVVDALGGTDSASYSVIINPLPSITTSSLPDGERAVAYSTVLDADNGTPPYSWAGSGLPAGLSIDPGTGELSGTPTVFGPFSITVTVTDVAGASVSRILSLTLHQEPTIGAGTLPDWTVDRAYPNTQINASGGNGTYTFTSTALPSGLSLGTSSGIISGTPTAAGTTNFTVTIQDSLGGTATQDYSITINAAPNITTASLPSWTVDIPYPSTTMSNTGGTPGISWTGTGLPAGLSIDPSTGEISGTPTATGPSSVTITVTDSAGATDASTYSLTINSPPTFTATSLPDGEENLAYDATPTTSGGTSPFTWSASGLPAGLSIDPGTGVISGTPSVAGVSTVDVTLTDAAGSTTNSSLSLTVHPQLTLGSKSDCQVQTDPTPITDFSLTANGGQGAYAWSATGLPAGLSIDPPTGVISGTTSDTLTSVTVTVTDGLGATATATFNVEPTISPSPEC